MSDQHALLKRWQHVCYTPPFGDHPGCSSEQQLSQLRCFVQDQHPTGLWAMHRKVELGRLTS
jgi:hypothetical protein